MATIISNDELVDFLMVGIKALETGQERERIGKSRLKWTAPKVALVELIYALHHSRCFNTGTLGLGETMKAFEDMLEVDLQNFHKVLTEIRARKVNRTKFLQQLQNNLEQLFLDTDL